MALKTDWITIARSGPTVDNREIKKAWLIDAAETYNPKTYTALIWPGHGVSWYNLGKVLQLRVVDNEEKATAGNSEKGLDLQAILQPNYDYLYDNKGGQLIFTSCEFITDFRQTGKAYLTGLAATDTPASAGLDEVRFSREQGQAFLTAPLALEAKAEKPGLLSRLFGHSTDEDLSMPSPALDALAAEIKALRTDIEAFAKPPTPPPAPSEPATISLEQFTALEAKFILLAEQMRAFSDAKPAYQGLADKLADLEQRFAAALAEANPSGSTPPKHTGGDGDSNKAFL